MQLAFWRQTPLLPPAITPSRQDPLLRVAAFLKFCFNASWHNTTLTMLAMWQSDLTVGFLSASVLVTALKLATKLNCFGKQCQL